MPTPWTKPEFSSPADEALATASPTSLAFARCLQAILIITESDLSDDAKIDLYHKAMRFFSHEMWLAGATKILEMASDKRRPESLPFEKAVTILFCEWTELELAAHDREKTPYFNALSLLSKLDLS